MALISEVSAIVPGEDFRVGLRIQHDEGFHTYWQNPGIVGIATQLNWSLPAGFSAAPIQWPFPEKVDMAGHPAHGYHREVLLTVTMTPPATLPSDEITLEAEAIWMACARTCHPGQQKVSLTLPVASTSKPDPRTRPFFARADAELPKALAEWQAKLLTAPDATPIQLQLTPPDGWGGSPDSLYFFSTDGQVSSDQEQAVAPGPNGSLLMTLQRSEFSPEGKTSLSGILSSNSTLGTISVRY
ncbi:protein-disulfide reductase DsbD domain-containing protein [Roseibacillus persicicus]|uniref:protein-disulfide reductase DsbD domain-containing protein n=1 Tax=Roseibacillus persicicus TaxID=454148 RepID=UPI00398A9A80